MVPLCYKNYRITPPNIRIPLFESNHALDLKIGENISNEIGIRIEGYIYIYIPWEYTPWNPGIFHYDYRHVQRAFVKRRRGTDKKQAC